MPDQLPDDQSESLDSRLQAIHQRANQTDPASARSTLRKPAVLLLSWASPGRIYDPKSPQWYLGLFAVGVISVVLLAIIREFMLILMVAAAIFVYYALARVEPGNVEHSIYSDGIESGGRKYLWEELRSFWIYDDRGQSMLRVDTKKHFPHALEILISDVSNQQIDQILTKYLPSQEQPVSEAGAMTDSALVSVANKIPFRGRLVKWVENSTGTKLD